MSEENTKSREFSPDEKAQIRYMFRFLLMVLAAVVAASLIMAVVVPIITR